MKAWRYIIKTILTTVPAMVLLSGCVLIDDELGECKQKTQNYELNYELRLVTNMTTELSTQLGLVTDVKLSTALKNHLSDIFTDYAHDVDLSFYDVDGDSARLQHDQHIMDANQHSYTLYLPMRQYMHLAVANVVKNPVVGISDDEYCHISRLATVTSNGSVPDTIDSHNTGLFTARLPMEVLGNVDQTFNVHLYMANCAAALVIDPQGLDISSLKVYTTGFATEYSICDSCYVFAAKSPIVRTTKLTTDDGDVCFVSVNFPSREPAASGAPQYRSTTRSIIETEEPFISEDDASTLWQFRAYITNSDGTITESVLSLRQPLRAGQLKIVKAFVNPDGSVRTDNPTVGVSVTLDWKQGTDFDVPL
jgi:hypothetical protein